MDANKIEDIKREFVEFLKKHKATISFCCDGISDLAGVYDPQIVISIEDGREEIDVLSSDDYYLDYSDL